MTVLDAYPHGRAGPSGPTSLYLTGTIDIFTSQALRERLLGALRSSTSLLILELSGVSFIDASGLAVLVGIQHRAKSMGITLALASPPPYMSRLLRVTGLDRSLRMAV
ncbi:anti-sigma factor antagonist [Sphaerisporangium album]|uniref:Anti-sigma factor antagonist n=1 Tax=Sphaerisporangium album TaxID=509200 RepID=A0A367FG65_9ACTN|nr:STAS domain-containing protein [Sphaerisporangium album]RCG28655.1 anti-sigma factor antagonist [Sphaerisporangium album]